MISKIKYYMSIVILAVIGLSINGLIYFLYNANDIMYPTTQVIMATKKIPYGTELKIHDNCEYTRIQQIKKPVGASTTSTLSKKYAAIEIGMNQMICDGMLVDTAKDPKRNIQMSITITPETFGAGIITKLDKIAILVSYKDLERKPDCIISEISVDDYRNQNMKAVTEKDSGAPNFAIISVSQSEFDKIDKASKLGKVIAVRYNGYKDRLTETFER